MGTTGTVGDVAGEAARVVEEVIPVGRDMREASGRGTALALSEDEPELYDALETGRQRPSRCWAARCCPTSPAGGQYDAARRGRSPWGDRSPDSQTGLVCYRLILEQLETSFERWNAG